MYQILIERGYNFQINIQILYFPDDGRTKPVPRVEATVKKDEPEYSCIFRATLGSKKISTIVHKILKPL
jgi:hypothetical protein